MLNHEAWNEQLTRELLPNTWDGYQMWVGWNRFSGTLITSSTLIDLDIMVAIRQSYWLHMHRAGLSLSLVIRHKPAHVFNYRVINSCIDKPSPSALTGFSTDNILLKTGTAMAVRAAPVPPALHSYIIGHHKPGRKVAQKKFGMYNTIFPRKDHVPWLGRTLD